MSETSKRKFRDGDHRELDSLRVGARVRDCEGDAWFKATDGRWICEVEPEAMHDSENLIDCYEPLTRIRRAVAPGGDS